VTTLSMSTGAAAFLPASVFRAGCLPPGDFFFGAAGFFPAPAFAAERDFEAAPFAAERDFEAAPFAAGRDFEAAPFFVAPDFFACDFFADDFAPPAFPACVLPPAFFEARFLASDFFLSALPLAIVLVFSNACAGGAIRSRSSKYEVHVVHYSVTSSPDDLS